MNRLTMVRLISWLRREPFVLSKIAVPDDLGPDTGELLTGLAPDQIPRKEGGSELRRSVRYAEAPGRKGTNRPLRMDVHVPNGTGPFPLVLYLPGGGFLVAPRFAARRQRAYVADGGFVVASVEYRTVNDGATFREGLADIQEAVRYLSDHADEFKVDVSGMAVWGESAGGYLACLAATTGDLAIPVRAAVTIVGASDLRFITDGFDDEMAAHWSGPTSSTTRYVGNPPPEAANPLAHIDATTPPFLLFAGEDDRIVSPRQSLLVHRALTSAGIPSQRFVVAGAGHGELGFKHNHNEVWTSVALMDMVRDFLRSKLTRSVAR